jgi:hypothetical protein
MVRRMSTAEEWREDGAAPAKRIGRPSKYRPWMIQRARELTAGGCTPFQVAKGIGISEVTLYEWRGRYPEFSEALRIGKENANQRVVSALFSKAVGFEHEATKIAINAEGKVTTVDYVERYAPDTSAAIFWLTNKDPENWRQRVEHSGPGGGPISFSIEGMPLAAGETERAELASAEAVPTLEGTYRDVTPEREPK